MAEELGSGLPAGLLGLAAVGLYLTVRAKPVLAAATRGRCCAGPLVGEVLDG